MSKVGKWESGKVVDDFSAMGLCYFQEIYYLCIQK